MERFIVGRCRNGKIVTSHPHVDSLVSYEEIFDAMAMLSILAVRELRRSNGSELAEELSLQVEQMERILSLSGQWQIQMQAIGAKSSLDIRNYAMNLLRPELRE